MHMPEHLAISLVGIAGAGKSTLAPLLASALGWHHMDTDRLLEAHYGRPLQEIHDSLGPEGFAACEGNLVRSLSVSRMVVSTGGSVVYSEPAVARLKLLGPVVWLRISQETFLARVGPAQGRAFVKPPTMSLADVHAQRDPLYAACADVVVDTDASTPQACAQDILAGIARHLEKQ